MKINKKMLSIPPHLSTSWEHIATLRLRDTDLVIQLTNGEHVIVSNLKPDILEKIFENHVAFLEEKGNQPSTENTFLSPQEAVDHSIASSSESTESLFKIGFGTPDSISAAMQHNPALAHAPDLPNEILSKIGAISKIIAPEDVAVPKAEPHCNCPFCQIARAIHATIGAEIKEESEEEVSAEELQFQEWQITQSGEKLFTVVNKLDSQEKYSVYLGRPIGCTCGREGCEHILAVLKS